MGALTEFDVAKSLFPFASKAISCLKDRELSESQNLLKEGSNIYYQGAPSQVQNKV